MKILVKAVVTGFGLSVGAALYKKLAKELGWNLEDAKEVAEAPPTRPDRDGGEPEPLHS
ncbi:MAG TPA: hypothetical protein VL463_15785 [Kofleriaceae bacterium]|jgi:hypothetical protein|nr:hypothetical protein [Kofleriaceae bacterium]